MKKFAAVVATALMLSAPAAGFAEAQGGMCYSPREFEAEQGLRIHSELMVIGLTCARMPGGQALYGKYTSFTRKNQQLIAGYETALISYYQSQGVGSPEKELHTLRTNLANKISQHAITMSTMNFCRHFGPRIDKALTMNQDKIREWARHVWPETPTSLPLCTRRS